MLGTRLPPQPGVRAFLLYFLFIGAGYILIEVGLIQKFVLFLGHPTYALTVVIFSMLISSGVGSAVSRRLLGKDEGRLIKALGCVALLAALLAAAGLGLLSAAGVAAPAVESSDHGGADRSARLCHGDAVPHRAAAAGGVAPPSVRWAWSLNAASSVLGSVGALVCAIYLGLVQTLIVGGLFYLAALAVIARIKISVPAAPEPGPGRVVLAK